MQCRSVGQMILLIGLLAGCVPYSTPADPSSLSRMPPPPLTVEALTSTYTPTPQSVLASTTVQPTDCVIYGGAPLPSLPDTDCRAWDFLNSLVSMTNQMVGKNEPLTASELLTLETEMYPLFVQTNINCGEWLDPPDYEPMTDYLGMLSVLGMQHYGYDVPTLFRYLIEEAATEDFVQQVESIGCVKSLLVLFVEYSE